MRLIIQRVSKASVVINHAEKKKMGTGLVILAGFEDSDTLEDVEWLAGKTINLRIFNDAEGIMNCSILEVHGSLMIISQFTLHASTRKGNRPSYIRAAKPEIALPLYNLFVQRLKELVETPVITGEFGAFMQVELVNEGPVTIIMDTKNKE